MASYPISNVTRDGLRARVALPDQRALGGVLVLPSWQGLKEGTDQTLGWLAAAGFVALAWDPFSAYAPDIPKEEKRRITRGELLDSAAQIEHSRWIGYLQRDWDVENVGCLGFCAGGRMGFTLGARDPRLKACVAAYATLRTPVPAYAEDVFALAHSVACPVQLQVPGIDDATPAENARRIRDLLEARPGHVTLTSWYPRATHGFMERMDDSHPDDLPAQALSWADSIAFLRWALA